ncbi:FAD-dependent oxidoreductase [Castellaniella sp.]|uniref:FAD-dependent oxidoreductase n=1 Tax=Castellaniella sp. TaxID=1955812 RepID=UPI003C72D597
MSAQPLVRKGMAPDPGAMRVPVVIIGAGACGLTAALRLAGSGIDTVLIERDAAPGGSSALSSGFIPAAGSAVQRAAGIEDDARRFAADIQAKAGGAAAAHLVAAYTDAAAPAMDELARHGLAFEVLDGFLYPGHTARRMHTLPERTGAALVAALARVATDAGAYLLNSALAREIWVDGHDRVSAVACERPDGTMEVIACDVLILACNGFGGNPSMVRRYLPAMQDAVYGGHAGNDGSAIEWGLQLGARLADLSAYQGHGSWATPLGVLVSWAVMMGGGVQINRNGRRFHDETHGYSEAAVQVLAQPGGIAWDVFDGQARALVSAFPDFMQAESNRAVRICADLAELAAVIGCDADVVSHTLGAIRPEAVDPYGRHFERGLSAPYYVVKVTGALFHTQGGLDIDAQCRVLGDGGLPFPNLLAAGGAARGVSGNDVSGYLSGNGLLSAVAGGYIAAGTAAAQLGRRLDIASD